MLDYNCRSALRFKIVEEKVGYLVSIAAGLALGLVSIPIGWVPKPRFFWGSAVFDPTSFAWVLSFLLFGPAAALLSSLVGTVGIWRLSSEPTPALGASLKFLGTLPVWLVPAMAVAFSLGGGYPNAALGDLGTYSMLMLGAAAVRCIIEVPLCYYAIAYYRSAISGQRISPAQAIEGFGSLGRYVLILTAFNIWLTVIDSLVPWLITYPTGLAAWLARLM